MIEISCRNCGEKKGVPSLLGDLRDCCPRCGQLLLGHALAATGPEAPPAFAQPLPLEESKPATAGASQLHVPLLTGAFFGLILAGGFVLLGQRLPVRVQGLVLGALNGVALSPFIVLGSFVAMILWPGSVNGIIADSLWSRMATAFFEGRHTRLIVIVVVFILLAMCGGGALGYKVKAIGPSLQITAVLGGTLLGAGIGVLCGMMLGKDRDTDAGPPSQ